MVEKQTAKRNRREEILQSLALMLESSDGSQRITTAKLAASVGVSEAALYRHFPSIGALMHYCDKQGRFQQVRWYVGDLKDIRPVR